MPDKVYLLYLIYSEAHLRSGMTIMEDFNRRVFGPKRVQTVVIDNKWDGKVEYRFDKRSVAICGDNSVREFSGLDQGVEYVRKSYLPGPDDIIVLANDTFHRSYGKEYLKLFNRREVNRALKQGAVVGYVDAYPKPVNLFGLPVQSWIRTSLIIAKWSSLGDLYPLAFRSFKDEQVFSDDAEKFFAPNAPLSENYQQYLKTWLFSNENDGEFKESWHSKKQLTAENLADFQGKARAIFSEHFFSARAQALDIPIYDVKQKRLVSKVI